MTELVIRDLGDNQIETSLQGKPTDLLALLYTMYTNDKEFKRLLDFFYEHKEQIDGQVQK